MVPFISNRSLNLAVELRADADVRLARVKIPTVVPRFMRIGKRKFEFVRVEEVIEHNLQSLFPGVEIVGAHLFRVIRDADVEIRELEAADLIATIEETLRLRRRSCCWRLRYLANLPSHHRRSVFLRIRHSSS
jgi:polyphosphate kinase